MKEKTPSDFIFEMINLKAIDSPPFNLDEDSVCDGCGNRFNPDKLFWDDETAKWLCDDCLGAIEMKG